MKYIIGFWVILLAVIGVVVCAVLFPLGIRFAFGMWPVPNGTPWTYQLWSGSGSSIPGWISAFAIITSALVAYNKLTCEHSFWCFRHRLFDLTDPDNGETHRYCHIHHPDKRSKSWSHAYRHEVLRRHQEAQQ